jgi:iron complex outermembrane receptor protein
VPLPAQVDLRGVPNSTPLNSNAIAGSATRLGLTARETPATVEVLSQQTIQERGYRTTTEAAQGAVGVLSGDAGAAPAGFSMRGFTFSEVNVLYNGISIGPQGVTSRLMDTYNLDQIEFLKGPSALMSGLNAIGGSVNYVSRQPHTGPIRNELDVGVDSWGTVRSHLGSGGSTSVRGLDYRVDLTQTRLNGFIDDVYSNLTGLAGQLNYRVNDTFKTFFAVDYKRDSGHAYWGTPMVPVGFAGANAKGGVVSGTAVNTFDGSIISPAAVDSRTLRTNYNVADNSAAARELWLRTGFEWAAANNVTVKNQSYYYQARRQYIDAETLAFNPATSTIDRDRFAVTHRQEVYGNNTDVKVDSNVFGMDNRLAGYLQLSRNDITFKQHAGGFPEDTVAVVSPSPGVYGPIAFDTRNSTLDTIAVAFEDRLQITRSFALIGGVRVDRFTLARDGINADGTIPAGQPFSKSWAPVSYRAAYTWEPLKNLMFYSMYATSYDPAAAGIFSISPANSLELTKARIYETGVKHLFWDNRAEWTLSAYDIKRENVFVRLSPAVVSLAGEVASKGVELAGAVRPVDNVKIWGNVAWIDAEYKNFQPFTGNTPSNIAPVITNAGASYRFSNWPWPVEIGGTVRHVGDRFLFEDNLTTMEAYTVGDVFMFVDIPKSAFSAVDQTRITFRVRNVTDKVYAAWSDPGYPDQFYLGLPRTYEVVASFRW